MHELEERAIYCDKLENERLNNIAALTEELNQRKKALAEFRKTAKGELAERAIFFDEQEIEKLEERIATLKSERAESSRQPNTSEQNDGWER